ncbi:MAG: hypothetical protein P4M11_00125 [Candidatus Pacebacteria bacterium]|nr:hypothetical protein [Candidatus Paceibacterota bacterium]
MSKIEAKHTPAACYTDRAGGWMIAAARGSLSSPRALHRAGEESPDSAGQCAG